MIKIKIFNNYSKQSMKTIEVSFTVSEVEGGNIMKPLIMSMIEDFQMSLQKVKIY